MCVCVCGHGWDCIDSWERNGIGRKREYMARSSIFLVDMRGGDG